MHPAYFETHFRTPDLGEWPPEFVIVSAYATTGESWPLERNIAADQELEKYLRGKSLWIRRITGYSPTTNHAEPSWATDLPFEAACDLGLSFHQDAIYHVLGDVLSVSYCDQRRGLVRVGNFRERVVAGE